MKSAVVHGGLLVVALIAATLTWASPDARDPSEIVVWDGGAIEVTGVEYVEGAGRVEVERRESSGRSYLWALVTRPPVQGATLSVVEEFAVGDEGTLLVEGLTRLTAVREIRAEFSEGQDGFGLDTGERSLAVRFSDGSERRLVVGDVVRGGGAIYVSEPGDGRVFVLDVGVISPFRQSGTSLRMVRYHDFRPDELEVVTARAGGAERTLRRGSVGSTSRNEWFPVGEEQYDVAFGVFLGMIDGLWIQEFVVDLPTAILQVVVRLDYQGTRGQDLGWLEVVKAPNASGGIDYFMRTPRTVSYVKIYGQGERIEQSVQTLLRPGAQL